MNICFIGRGMLDCLVQAESMHDGKTGYHVKVSFVNIRQPRRIKPVKRTKHTMRLLMPEHQWEDFMCTDLSRHLQLYDNLIYGVQIHLPRTSDRHYQKSETYRAGTFTGIIKIWKYNLLVLYEIHRCDVLLEHMRSLCHVNKRTYHCTCSDFIIDGTLPRLAVCTSTLNYYWAPRSWIGLG